MRYWTAQTRKILKELDVTQQRPPKTFSSRGVVGTNIGKQYL
jgi:hypothetical protein